MKLKIVVLLAALLVLVGSIVAGLYWIGNFGEDLDVYSYPLSVDDRSYLVTVVANWTSQPKVYLPEFDGAYVSVDFFGPDRETVYFNVTVPKDLIWGDISLVWKYYEQSPDRYTLSSNATHNSVEMTFAHVATIEHFEIRGTERAW
ncbi:MAG: hypothetical protein NWF04_03130 [Candidatus Bathyarchaeota archaeon]|nr:hypothetical protein [Candidatus Bathyarchaeota archaeon]